MSHRGSSFSLDDDQRSFHHSSEQHSALLRKIDDRKIQRFILCKGRISEDQQRQRPELTSKHCFLLEAAERGIATFLRFMYHGVDELTVKLGLFVSANDMESRMNNEQPKELLFRSSELKLQTASDIPMSADFLLTLLLEHVMRHLHKHCGEGVIFDVKRVEVEVQRLKWTDADHQRASANEAQQFGCKNDSENGYSSAHGALHYGLQRCSSSGEFIVVPYSLQSASWSGDDAMPHYIVTTGVSGVTRSVVPIRNLRNFMRPAMAGALLTCSRCGARYMEQAHLTLHERLQCGRHFEIIEMPEDRVELYEECLPLQCEALDYPIFGIPKQKKPQTNGTKNHRRK